MRLDGWKSIGAHFGRERSTVIRWASDRGMPVHRVPGSGRGSVYALTEELDAWLAASEGETASPAPPEPSPAPRHTPYRKTWRWLGLPVLLVIAGVSTFAFGGRDEAPPAAALPADKGTAERYLDARADWAQRTPRSIDRAIAKLQDVVEREPGFAPAYAALADCYVLAREFGSMSDAEAFAKAQAATDTALRIDPRNPAALRVRGFIEYWWLHDGPAAADRFERSLAIAPDLAQTHFWYGNILIDNGDMAAGLAQLDEARLLEPASITIQTDIAWARWSSGQEAEARGTLERLRERNPDLATIRDYLSVLYLAEGDFAGFVRENSEEAVIRGEPGATARAERLARAYEADRDGFLAILIDEAVREAEAGSGLTLVWPAFIASAGRDRQALLRLLRTAEARNETWGSAGLIRHIRDSWSADRAILTLLDRRTPRLIAKEPAAK